MNPKIIIRDETKADISAITEVTVAAFKALKISNHTEQFIVQALRAAGALSVMGNNVHERHQTDGRLEKPLERNAAIEETAAV